jgi:hypothetical protein
MLPAELAKMTSWHDLPEMAWSAHLLSNGFRVGLA